MAVVLKALKKLSYVKPTGSPHGLCGALQLSIGFLLLRHTLTGNFEPFESGSLLLPSYWICGLLMSIGALRITKQAPKMLKAVFKYSAILQMVLMYYMYRFSYFHHEATDILDKVMGPLYFVTVCTLIVTAYGIGNLGIFGSILYMTMFTVAGYILPVTLYGQPYVDCLEEHFPMQRIGFVSYVFGSITTIYSLCMFMVTVVLRIGPEKVGFINAVFAFGVPVFGIIIATVLTQEVFMPIVSTQRLIIFCPRPEPSSTEDYIESLFNLSTVAQSTLSLGGNQFAFHNISI